MSASTARVALLDRLSHWCASGPAVGDAFDRVSSWALGLGERPQQATCDLVSAEILDLMTESSQAGFDRVNPSLPLHGEEEFTEWPDDEIEAGCVLVQELAGEGCGDAVAPAYEFPVDVKAALRVAERAVGR